MARTLDAYLDLQQVPELAPLQQAISALKFKLTLDEAYQPFESQGYLPCTFDGEDAGVDLRFERDVALPEVAWPAGVSPAVASVRLRIRWGGDVREQLSALVIAAALSQSFAAVIVDPDKATVCSGADLLKQAKALFDDNF